MSVRMMAGAVAALMLAPIASRAAPLLFTFSDPFASEVITFQLDSNPTPTTFDQNTFAVSVLDATLNGVADSNLDVMSFADSTTDGSLSSVDLVIAYSSPGNQLFSGRTVSPTFSVGSFDMFDPGTFGPATLDITPLSAAPEPSTWALMFAGLGLAGWTMRRRQPRSALTDLNRSSIPDGRSLPEF